MGVYDKLNCYGHFYKIIKDGVEIVNCRSQLDIINSDIIDAEDIGISRPDSLAIMMNPGTSKPKDHGYQEQEIDVRKFFNRVNEKEFVPTIPDDTLKRIMKIMQHKNWKHVRVINLSDIRQHKSEKLTVELNKYKLHSLNHEHSLFSVIRSAELVEVLEKVQGKPIILAWGTRTCLKPYVIECMDKLRDNTFYGARAAKEGYYHHPLTTRISWTKYLIELLNDIEET